MASKVNKSVVIGLVGGIVVMVAVVVVVLNVVLKSGADLAAQGDRLMEQQKYEEAAIAFSKAVNKDQNNAGYYRKWAEALSKQTPTSVQAYTDRYKQWVSAQNGIAQVLRTDPAAHRAVLDLDLRAARMTSRPGQMWQTLENKASDVLARMRNEPAEKTDQIRRYRGIATAGRMSQSAEIPAEERERAKQDLLAAMNGPEHDGLAAAYYGELIRWWSTKLRQTANQEKADTLMAEGLAVLRDFCAKNPTSSIGRLGLVQLEIADAQVRRPMEDISGELRPKIEELLATMESEDPKTLDALAVTNGLQMAVTIKADRAVERGVAVYEKLCAAHPGDAEAMLLRARFKANTQSPKEAAAEFKAIMDLPNQPVSPAGINLFGVRDTAAILRTETLTAAAEREMTDKTKSKEERALALDQAKAARDELKARPTVDNSAKLLADAKIAWLNGEGGDARRLLDQYHRSLTPPYSDTGALSLSFQILRQQGLKGEAMSMLNRLLEMKVFSAEIYKQKALLEVELGNAPSALNSVDAGLALAPTDELLLRLKRDILSRLGNGAAGPATPFDTAINEAQKALTAAPPDKQRARQQGNEALSLASTAEEFVKATVVLANVGRADGLAAAKRGIERFPDNKQMLGLKSQLEIEDPVGDMLKRIDQATELTPVEKAARKYVLLSNAGRAEETRKQAEELAKLDPDHQLVVADRFEQAISDRDEAGKIKPEALARAKALAQTAKDRNLDKVEGRIYAARLAEAEGRIADTIPLLERATELDPQNPLTWRFLASAYLAVNNLSKGLSAVERSLQISPDDVGAIVSRIRILSSMDRSADALAAAREASRMGIFDRTFVHLWMLLESRVGDKDVALGTRERVFNLQPENMENAVEYAKCLVLAQRIDEAGAVLDKIEAAATPGDAGKTLRQAVAMLRAAVRGAKGDTAGALSEADKIAAELPEKPAQRREGFYIDFAELARALGAADLSQQSLDRARQYQDPEFMRVDRMLGDSFFGSGEWEKARAAYERARSNIKEDQNNLLQKRITECLMKDKRYDEAQKLIDSMGGDKSTDLQVLLLGAQLQFSKGDRPRGMQLLDKAVAAAPGTALSYRQRGIERIKDPRTIDDGIVDLEQALGFEPRNVDLTVMLSRAYLRKGEPAKAMGALDKSLTIMPDNAVLRNEQVQLLLAQQRYDEAIAACDAAAKTDAGNPRWWLLKGVVHQMRNDQMTASRCFEEAWRIRRSLDSGKALADSLMAAYDQQQGQKNPALLDRARQVLADPGAGLDREPAVRLSRVTLALRQGRRPEAVSDLRAVVTSSDFKLTDAQRAAMLLDELMRPFAGNLTEVVRLLDEVRPAAGWPDMFTVALCRARLADKLSQDQALTDLEGLIGSQDRGAALNAASSAGASAFALGKTDAAVRILQRGLEIDPDSVELNNNLAYVLCVGKKDAAAALPRAQRAVQLSPGNPNILDTLGVIYSELNQLDKAEETLSQARAIATDGVTRTMPTVHLAIVKWKRRQQSEAQRLLDELKALMETEPRVKRNYSKDIEALEKTIQTAP